jgi:hypothetical protein
MKRMPTTKLLEPVLAGLSKFAHLINIEFLDDPIFCLELYRQYYSSTTTALSFAYQ